jgi:ABC-type dipeptide/oligopeptide/nickel transport system ATPase component
MERVSANSLEIFNSSARILIAGFSGCGKSILIGQLIMKYIDTFSEIIISGSENFPIDKHPKIKIHTGEHAYDPFTESKDFSMRRLIIYDDFMLDNVSGKIIAKVFIKGRHLSLSSIYIAQNILHNSPYHRAIALNCNYFIIMRMRSIMQIKYFARTFLDKTKIEDFVSVYKKYIEKKKYSHILIDFTQFSDSPLLIRTNIVGKEFEKAILI